MKTIFVDAHVLDGEYQGTYTYIKELYTEILKQQSNIVVYFGVANVENARKIFEKFENAKYIQYQSKSSFKRIFIEIPKIIDTMSFDYAHFQYVIPFRKNKNCKYIVTIHDILFNDFKDDFSFLYRMQRNILFYLSAKRSDFLLTVSNYSKKRIAEEYKINDKEIIVTNNAVSEDFYNFKITKKESKKIIENKYGIQKFILYMSRIEPRKNQLLLLKAYVELELWKKELNLVFIGKNSLDVGLHNFINTLDEDVRKYIIWKEQVQFQSLLHFLNASELFVYPSKAEGFGIPPLEASALEVPVLCSNVTAMEDFSFFQPYTFNPDQYDEFIQKFSTILRDIDLINTADIKRKILEKYSWKLSAEKFIKGILK